MNRAYPQIARRRSRTRRKRPDLPEFAFMDHKAVTLRGSAKKARRRELFERSAGKCEDNANQDKVCLKILGKAPEGNTCLQTPGTCESCPEWHSRRCERPITWDSMEWSHLHHGANKCDCMACGIASCKECHRRRHNPKPCPPKHHGNNVVEELK